MPVVNYVNNVPQAGDLISQSQPSLLTNTQAAYAILNGGVDASKDILNFDNVNAGMHNSVQFPVASAMVPAVTAGKISLYTQNNGTTARNEIYVQPSGNNAQGNLGAAYPMTAAGSGLTGFSYLASGMIMQWGGGNIAIDGQNFAFAIPFPTQCLQVIICLVKSHGDTNVVSVVNGSVNVNGFNATSYTVGGAPAFQASLCSYIAIGF